MRILPSGGLPITTLALGQLASRTPAEPGFGDEVLRGHLAYDAVCLSALRRDLGGVVVERAEDGFVAFAGAFGQFVDLFKQGFQRQGAARSLRR